MIRKTLIAAAALVALSATVAAPTAEARMRFNGLGLNGLRDNGLQSNGLAFNGMNLNGLTLNGFRMNGLKFNAAAPDAGTSADAGGLLAITLPSGVTFSAE